MIYLTLSWIFFKIGLFSFGGGLAMIPLIEKEVTTHGWIPAREFADIVAISQMTPGPLAVNAATYVGYRVAGFWGSASATLGVFLPSFIIVLIVASFMKKFQENWIVNTVLKGLRPATIGLISSAVVLFSEMSVFTGTLPFTDILTPRDPSAFGVSFGGLVIFLIVFIGSRWFKLKPIPAVILSAVLGIILR
ncbi:MAG TPA: chromate transporter [Spirochaetia bacterium]|nr:chromate transporter [Spirochaetia bacterium]